MRITACLLLLFVAGPVSAQPSPDFIASQLYRMLNGRMLPPPPQGYGAPLPPQEGGQWLGGTPGMLSETPSFNCSTVALKGRSAVGKILCSGPEGAAADWDLNAALRATAGTKDPVGQNTLDKEQERWRAWLNARCQLPNSTFGISLAQKQCVLREFHARAAALRAQLGGDALAESRLTPEQRADIQAALRTRGVLSGTADGEFGADTRAAIRNFQQAQGTAETGFLTSEELSRLRQGATRQAADAPAARSVPPEPTPTQPRASAPPAHSADTAAAPVSLPPANPIPKPEPSTGPEVVARDCDKQAGDPNDKNRKGDGVVFARIDERRAIESCSAAVAANPNNPRLMHQLGRAYAKAELWIDALDRWTKASSLGYAASEAALGFLYSNGKGVTADDVAALKWYRKGAEHGNPNGQAGLGTMLLNGRGVPADPEEGRMWLQEAAEQGHLFAQSL